MIYTRDTMPVKQQPKVYSQAVMDAANQMLVQAEKVAMDAAGKGYSVTVIDKNAGLFWRELLVVAGDDFAYEICQGPRVTGPLTRDEALGFIAAAITVEERAL